MNLAPPERPAGEATSGSGAATVFVSRTFSRPAVLAAAAALAVVAGAATWYWAMTPAPRPAPPPQAQAGHPAPAQPTPAAPADKTAAANAAPAASSPPSAQPINAPLASFMRSNDGWSVTVSFIEPVAAIAWRLGAFGPFKETGVADALDPRTRRRMANPSFELDADQPATTIEIRAVDADGRTFGPFPVAFDPDAELARGDRRTLEMTMGSWLSFRDYNGLLVYYTHLVSYRCAIREVRIGIDTTVPNKVVPLGACDPKHPYEIPSNAETYLRLPPATQMVSIELTYRDGSVSETKTFRR